MGITVCAMVNNRHDSRISNFLISLTNQTITPDNVIICDTSNDLSLQRTSYTLCEDVSAVHISLPLPILGKTRGLNACLAKSETEYTLFTDIDLYFHPVFIETVLSIIAPEIFVQAICAYLPPDANLSLPWDSLLKQASAFHEISHRFSPGACQATSTSWFKSVGGYDERFNGLSGPDDDMMVRARKAGLYDVWIDDVLIFHQWHPTSKWKGMDSALFSADPEIIANQ